ncbi:MAG: NADH-quinone oxidoreductase subunit C, partial [Spirochaetota bacterium]
MTDDETPFVSLATERALPFGELPLLDPGAFCQSIKDGISADLRVVSMFGSLAQEGGAAFGATDIFVVLADDRENGLFAGRTRVAGGTFPSISSDCPQVQAFEREIAEQFGLIPEGHPWFKPLRYRASWTGRDAWGRAAGAVIPPGVGAFYRVEGEEVHEVAVGPVHAGIIEPGHFRFQCHGEEVFHLEIALGYQHRGVEEALRGGPDKRSIHYAETLAGDTTIAHSTAYCQILEGLSRCRRPVRADVLRGIALELERLANHTGDLGAISGDTGYLPTASFCGRIRGDFLNMTALLCGNRFGRGLVVAGG